MERLYTTWQQAIDEAMEAMEYEHLPKRLATISEYYHDMVLVLLTDLEPSAEAYRAVIALRTAKDIHVAKVAKKSKPQRDDFEVMGGRA